MRLIQSRPKIHWMAIPSHECRLIIKNNGAYFYKNQLITFNEHEKLAAIRFMESMMPKSNAVALNPAIRNAVNKSRSGLTKIDTGVRAGPSQLRSENNPQNIYKFAKHSYAGLSFNEILEKY